ncbi:hypothetical protein RIF29_06517 [Crotalaria pallida]|uniref:Uncharacterized protein n=1 Tax=Crotalaria pallida TaxID=3830 RepID=A0AAN9J4V1_CROPI
MLFISVNQCVCVEEQKLFLHFFFFFFFAPVPFFPSFIPFTLIYLFIYRFIFLFLFSLSQHFLILSLLAFTYSNPFLPLIPSFFLLSILSLRSFSSSLHTHPLFSSPRNHSVPPLSTHQNKNSIFLCLEAHTTRPTS